MELLRSKLDLSHKQETSPSRSQSVTTSDVPVVKKNTSKVTENDQDIFALGDAALELDAINLDDIFSSFSLDKNVVLNGRLSRDENIHVSEFDEELQDGTQVKSKVIRGPTFQSETSVIQNLNGPSSTIENRIQGKTWAKPSNEHVTDFILTPLKNKRSSGSYDNVRSKRLSFLDQRDRAGTPLLSEEQEDQFFQDETSNMYPTDFLTCEDAPPFPVRLEDLAATPRKENTLRDNGMPMQDRQHSITSVETCTLTEPTSPGLYETPGHDMPKSPGSESIAFFTPNHALPSELTTKTLQEQESDTVSVDMGCLNCHMTPFLTSSAGTRKRKKTKETTKGTTKMTQGGMPNEKSVPGVTSLVANYAQMLYTDQKQFVDTMFRAVKLNKVDVVKILCKIVQKSGLKLHESLLREPESSATILHVALLYNNVETIDFLLEMKDPALILAKYETAEYHNQTGLHVAVANGNVDIIEKLLLALDGPERQVLINTRADGHYFKARHPHGQLCLTAAALAGHCEVLKLLVKYGGNLALQNNRGNTLLHSLILQSAGSDKRDDYKKIFEHIWQAALVKAETLNYDSRNEQHRKLQERQMQGSIFKQLMIIRNEDGYTPLALATTTMSPLLLHMLNFDGIYKIPQSKLGSIAWVTYDVSEITSFATGRYNKFSLIHILAHSGQLLSRGADPNVTDDIDVFSIEPIRTILERKWSVYRLLYIFWCITHILYMITFTACTIEANSSPLFATFHAKPDTSFDVKWWLIIFTVLPLAYIILEILDLFGNKPYRAQYMSNQNIILRLVKCAKSEWTIVGNGPYRCVQLGFSAFTIQWFMLYANKDPSQDISLAMSLLLGWIFVLFFTRGCRVTCRFSIMIQNLFLSDLIYFLTVYGIVLVGFSFAMNAMFTYLGSAELAISKVFYDMMNVVTDLDQKQTIDESRHRLFTKLLLIVYAIVAVILLLNMLIAMMNTSYEIVTVTRCNLWKQQQLSIMLMIERRFFWLKKLVCKSEESIYIENQDQEPSYYMDVTMVHS